jgi:hypothetical protein
MGCPTHRRVLQGRFANRPYNPCDRAPMMFAHTTHAPVRTACRGDAVRRPGTSVHPGPIVYQRGDRTCTAPQRATHRVAPTLPAGRARVPMNHARFGAG